MSEGKAKEIAQQLWSITAILEDLSLILSTYAIAHNHL